MIYVLSFSYSGAKISASDIRSEDNKTFIFASEQAAYKKVYSMVLMYLIKTRPPADKITKFIDNIEDFLKTSKHVSEIDYDHVKKTCDIFGFTFHIYETQMYSEDDFRKDVDTFMNYVTMHEIIK